MSYLEPLPENCPPDEAEDIASTRVVYRLVRCNPPVLDDFRSQRPEKARLGFQRSGRVQSAGPVGLCKPGGLR